MIQRISLSKRVLSERLTPRIA